MPIPPLGPITWLLQRLSGLGQWIYAKWEQRQLNEAVRSWSGVDFRCLSNAVSYYYQNKGVPLFSYPGSSTPVPLYVRPFWLNLDETSLVMTCKPIERPVQLGAREKQFSELYPKLRKALALTELWNGRVFRLVRLDASENVLRLEFELGHFFDALACQYVLENEVRVALYGQPQTTTVEHDLLPLRESLASTVEAIERFCETQVVRIGISNLILFRVDQETYRPAIRARGVQSMGHIGNFDPISSGMFDISTQDPKTDFKIQYKVLKEVYEELFGGKEVEKEMSGLDPDFFFEKPPIKDLKSMLDDGRATFRVTGFCVDVIRMIPEITTVLVVRDESYYRKYRGKFEINLEYGPPSSCEIPREITNVDKYLTQQFPSSPGQPDRGKGFDPSKWTLPGAFCFYQGLKRAVEEQLL